MLIFNEESIFKYNDKQCYVNKIDLSILDFICGVIPGSNYIISSPNKRLVIPLLLQLFHYDYQNGYKKRADFGRRASILVITKKLDYYRDVFANLKVSTSYVIKSSIQKQGFFLGKRENLINDPYNAQSYWKDHLYSRYKHNIPDYVMYKNIFPVSIGHKNINILSRDNLGRRDNQSPCFFITSNANFYSDHNTLTFDYIVLDYSRMENHINLPYNDIPKMHFFDTLLDDRMLYLKNIRSTVLIGVDNPAIKYFAKGNVSSNNQYSFSLDYLEMQNRLQLTKVKLEHVSTLFDDKLEEFFEKWEDAKKVGGNEHEKRLVALLANNVFSLPVTAVEYDTLACKDYYMVSNLDMLRELRVADTLYRNINLARCFELLEDIYKELDEYCPKQDILFRHLKRLILKQEIACIITDNRTANIALKKVVAESFNIDISELEDFGIRILTYKKAKSLPEPLKCNYLYIVGCNNLRRLSVLQRVVFHEAIIFLYTTEIINIKKRLLEMDEIYERSLIDTHMQSMINENSFNLNISTYKYLINRLRTVKLTKEKYEHVNFDKLLEIVNKVTVGRRTQKVPGTVEAKAIKFDDGSFCFIELNNKLKLMSPSQKTIIEAKYTEVLPGDKCVFVDGEIHHDMYTNVLKKLESNSKYLTYIFLIEKWHEILEDQCLAKELSYTDIFENLKRYGWKKISSQTVKGWLERSTLGPDSNEDIKLLGEILNVKFFKENYNQIFQVLEKIRVLRRSISRTINRLIFASQKRGHKADNKLLRDYGISEEELAQAIQIKVVSSTGDQTYYVRPYETGKIINVMEGIN